MSFRGDRFAVTPIELDSARARRLREALPGRALRVGPLAVLAARARRSPSSASRRSCARRTRCSRRCARRRRPPGSLALAEPFRGRSKDAQVTRALERLRYHPAPGEVLGSVSFWRSAPFLWPPPPSPRAAACPATRSRKVDDTTIKKATFDHWMRRSRPSPRSSPARPLRPRCPTRPTTPSASPRLRKALPKPAKGQKAPTDAQLHRPVQAAVRGPARPGHAVPDQRRVAARRGRRPGHQGQRGRDHASPTTSRRRSSSPSPPTSPPSSSSPG